MTDEFTKKFEQDLFNGKGAGCRGPGSSDTQVIWNSRWKAHHPGKRVLIGMGFLVQQAHKSSNRGHGIGYSCFL
jgi:hypothetical protein